MARNGAGIFSVINTFLSGATITASSHNANWTDIATEMTNSVAADGQTTITGALKGAVGSAASPSYTFSTDTDTGFYHSGANEISGAVGGSQIHKINSSGVDVVTGKLRESGNALVPAGVVNWFAGSSVPSGWLACDGSAVSRTTYASLFSALGIAHGSGDGSTTFNVPDIGGRVIAGKEASATRLTTAASGVDGGTLGASGGSPSVTISKANLPSYNLDITGLTATPTVEGSPAFAGNNNFNATGSGAFPTVRFNATPNLSVAIGGTLNSGGSGTAVSNVQPTIVLIPIIKT